MGIYRIAIILIFLISISHSRNTLEVIEDGKVITHIEIRKGSIIVCDGRWANTIKKVLKITNNGRIKWIIHQKHVIKEIGYCYDTPFIFEY